MKELLLKMGVAEDAKPEDAVKYFDEHYVPKLRVTELETELTTYKDSLGKSLGAVDAVVKRGAKQILGDDLGGIVLKEGMKTSEFVEQVFLKVDGKIADLKRTTPEADKQIGELQTKYNLLQKQFEQKDGEVVTLNQRLAEVEQDKSKTVGQIELRYAEDKLFEDARWSKAATELPDVKVGFRKTFSEKFDLMKHDGDLPLKTATGEIRKGDWVLKTKSGEVPKNANNTAYLTPFEVLQKEMQERKVWQENNLTDEKKPWEKHRLPEGEDKKRKFTPRPSINSPTIIQ